MKYRCLQLYNNDCAVACAKMLLANFHKDKNYLLIPQPKEDMAYSLLDIEEFVNKNGLITESYYVSDYFEIKSFPFICVMNGKENKHFVIVEKIINNLVYVFDPSSGERMIPFDLFLSLSSNIVLVVEEVKKEKCKNYYKFSMKKYEFWLIFINAMQIFFLFLSSFELENHSTRIIWYLICFLLLKIIDIFVNFKFLKNYDKKEIYRAFTYKIDKNQIKDEYLLKRELFGYYNKFITSIMIIFILIFILMFNDYKNIIGISFILIYLFIEDMYLIKRNNQYFERVNDLENKGTYLDFENADKIAYSYAHKLNFYNVIKILLVLSIISLICFFNNNYSPLIYYSITYLIICLEIKKMLSMKQDKLLLNKKIHRHQNIFVQKRDENDK